MACILCYIEGNLLVGFRVKCAEDKVVKITKSKCSNKQQYQSVPITISFVPPLVIIQTQLVILHTAHRTSCTLWAVLCFSKCCSYLFVTCHLWWVIVTGRELDVCVRKYIEDKDRTLMEGGGKGQRTVWTPQITKWQVRSDTKNRDCACNPSYLTISRNQLESPSK